MASPPGFEPGFQP